MSTNTCTPRTSSTWDVDPAHSSLGFTVRHLVISKVHGRFVRWAGTLLIDDAQPERSRVQVRAEAASIDTHEPQRDAHLRSADFLDTERHPAITFTSTHIEKAGDQRYQVTGISPLPASPVRSGSRSRRWAGPATPGAASGPDSPAGPRSTAATSAWCGTRRSRPEVWWSARRSRSRSRSKP